MHCRSQQFLSQPADVSNFVTGKACRRRHRDEKRFRSQLVQTDNCTTFLADLTVSHSGKVACGRKRRKDRQADRRSTSYASREPLSSCTSAVARASLRVSDLAGNILARFFFDGWGEPPTSRLTGDAFYCATRTWRNRRARRSRVPAVYRLEERYSTDCLSDRKGQLAQAERELRAQG